MKKLSNLMKVFLMTALTFIAIDSVAGNEESGKKKPEETNETRKIEMLQELKEIEIQLIEKYIADFDTPEIEGHKIMIYDISGKLIYEGYELDQNCMINNCDFMFTSGNTSFYLKTN